MEIDLQGKPVHPTAEPGIRGIKMREYYAAHCPLTMTEAWSLYCRMAMGGDISIVMIGQHNTSLPEFMRYWSSLRFQYADAMAEENRSALGA